METAQIYSWDILTLLILRLHKKKVQKNINLLDFFIRLFMGFESKPELSLDN